jgi:hypothetical protein
MNTPEKARDEAPPIGRSNVAPLLTVLALPREKTRRGAVVE